MTFLPFLADMLLICGTVALAIYCWRLTQPVQDSGSEASVSDQDDGTEARLHEAQAALKTAVAAAEDCVARLEAGANRAEDDIARLDMLLAAAGDVEPSPPVSAAAPAADAVISFRGARSERS
jgi:hypothetical protein